VLLHEHELRIGNYASAFMLTGLAVRLAHCHQLSMEASLRVFSSEKAPPPPTILESRRRLMWSIYVMDAWVGSGVDELTLIQEKNLRLQLPGNESNFVLEIPNPQEHSPVVLGMNFGNSITQLDLGAQFVRLISIRKKVLRYDERTASEFCVALD
jgi:hypothetical protein